MAKYVYPAIFTLEKNNQYSIHFPDFESCYTCGDDLQDGFDMASDVLCLTLYDLEEEKKTIPSPSNPKSIESGENSFVTLVPCDTLEYRKFFDNKAVKKNLTIPSWLNTAAEREGVNFSSVLQEALKDKLSV